MESRSYTVHTAPDLPRWRALVDDLLLPLDIRSDHPSFGATIEAVAVNGIRLFTVTAGPHHADRTDRLASAGASSGADPFFTISLQLEGSSSIKQGGSHALLQPGDFTVYDSTLPYTRRFDGHSSSLVVMFPQQLISLPPQALAGIAGQAISGAAGTGAIVSAFLTGVARNLPALDGKLGLGLAGSMVDLVTAAFADAMGFHPVSSSRLEQAMAVRNWIMDRLGDPGLSPGAIAAGNFISTRQLHLLFREQGTTVSTWIRERRLEMARRDLADPLRAEDPVAAVAQRWGFADARHFARVFKAAYGRPPVQYRRAGLDLASG